MINGAHVGVYSKDAEVDRAFFRDILGFTSVDAGNRWLIFGLPAAESAFGQNTCRKPSVNRYDIDS